MTPRPTDRRGRAGAPIAAAALVTCAFVWLVSLTLTFASGFDVAPIDATDVSELPFSHLMTGFVVIGVPALAAWGVSVNHRCINLTVRRILLTVISLMVIWLCAASAATIVFGVNDPPLLAIAVVSDLAIALFIESYIDARLLPSMHRYRMMFRRLPFDLKIINDGGLVIYQTDISRPLDNTTLWRLATRTSETVGAHVVTSDDGAIAPSYYSESIPDAVFKLYALDAGIALLTEDASEINKLQQRLEDRRAQLTSQNAILRRNHAMQSLLFRQRRERELGERVERDLASTAAQISRILDNRIVGDSPYARAERIQQLNLVKVLVAYSKRKGMLALAAAEYEALTSEQLELVAREAMADLNSIGIECAVLVESGSTIPIAAFNTIYDCFYDCVIGVLPFTDPVIMTYITTHGDMIEMRANIECAIGLTGGSDVEMIPQIATSTEPWTAVQLEIARNLEGRLATRGGDYSVQLDEGLVNVTVRAAAPTPSRKPKPGVGKAPASTPEDGPEGADEEVSG